MIDNMVLQVQMIKVENVILSKETRSPTCVTDHAHREDVEYMVAYADTNCAKCNKHK